LNKDSHLNYEIINLMTVYCGEISFCSNTYDNLLILWFSNEYICAIYILLVHLEYHF
jgi:hypothetical protein